jgi:hypothetical protein
MSLFIISTHVRLYFLNGPFHSRIATVLLHASVIYVQIISLRWEVFVGLSFTWKPNAKLISLQQYTALHCRYCNVVESRLFL